MFENPDFEVDKEADEYRLLNPVLARHDKKKSKPKIEEINNEVIKNAFILTYIIINHLITIID